MAPDHHTVTPDLPFGVGVGRESMHAVIHVAVFTCALIFSAEAGAQGLTGEVRNEQWGISFTVPDGWIGQQGESGYVFGSETLHGLILLMPHEYGSLEELQAEARKGLDDGYGTRLEVQGAIQPFGENGVAAEFSGVLEGQEARAYAVSVLSPHSGGVTLLTAVAPASYTAEYATRIQRMAAGIRFSEPPAAAEDEGWTSSLRGTRLTYLYSYYSGGVDGSYAGASEETVIDLCSAGHFFFSGSSSLAIDGGSGGGYNASGHTGGSNQGSGQWQVVSQSGQPTLVLTYHGGEVASYTLSYPDEKVHLNDRRFFWTNHESPADYRPQCP